ncbi:hypothetical protein TSMEX_007838 [Taenia solium]|eukprot:TsM_001139600 transcript=TsM_001139600 gene=TsM_001139600
MRAFLKYYEGGREHGIEGLMPIHQRNGMPAVSSPYQTKGGQWMGVCVASWHSLYPPFAQPPDHVIYSRSLKGGLHTCSDARPYLHLCGHDFTGYGVTWRRGVVFSNAAVQLTSSHPRVLPHHPFPRRRKAYSSTFTSSGVGSSDGGGGSGGGGAECKFTTGGNLFAGASAPSKVTEHGDTLGVAGGITTLPPRIPRFTDFGVRPRRWRRRLSGLLSRFSFLLTTHSLTDGAQQTSTVLDPHYSIGYGSNRIQPTPSSLAALRSGDGDFVVDPTLSVFGSGGSRGGSRSGYAGRRNPLVFDVYVVIEEGVNDREILPDYSKSKTSHENATPGRQNSQSLQGNNACCMQ